MNATPLVALPGILLDGRSQAALLQALPSTHPRLSGAGHLFSVQQAAMTAAQLHPFLTRLATPKEPCL